jgi:hypothetical protein
METVLPNMTRFATRATAALLATAVALGAYATDFTDAFRGPSASYLVTPIGEVYTIGPGRSLQKIFIFHDARNLSHRWSRPPASIVRWKSEWLVSDGSTHLARFHEDGLFDSLVDSPVPVRNLAVSKDAIWAVSLAARNPAEQLWRSTDGRTFAPYAGSASRAPLESPVYNLLVLSAAPSGEVYVASVVGAPLVHRIWPQDRTLDIHLAYSRSKPRAGMEEVFGAVDDVSPYSLPLRDLVPLPDGGLAVLRNREDVRGSTARLELLKGRRADRYDRAGRQVATAVFERSVHWLTEVTDKSVTGVSNAGDVVVATWGKPIPGEILTP